jgi:hypothetical protein
VIYSRIRIRIHNRIRIPYWIRICNQIWIRNQIWICNWIRICVLYYSYFSNSGKADTVPLLIARSRLTIFCDQPKSRYDGPVSLRQLGLAGRTSRQYVELRSLFVTLTHGKQIVIAKQQKNYNIADFSP